MTNDTKSTGLAGVMAGESFSISDAVGGVRGALESLLPGLVFVVTFLVTGELWWTVGLSAGVSVLFCLIRVTQRQPLTQAAAGLLGVLIGVVWAASSGKAENYYAWGILTNAAYGVVLLVSVLIRQPIAAWAVQFLWTLPAGWMRSIEMRLLYRRCVAVTWAWVAVFAIRLAVQWPLYASGQVTALGVAKLALGLPLFALAVWLTWVLLRNLRPAAEEAAEDVEADDDSESTVSRPTVGQSDGASER